MMLRATAEGVDSTRYPALVARALWSLGNTLNRGEGWETGLEMARTSTRLFSRAGERENEGAVLAVESDARFVLGEPDSGYVAIHRALERLRPYRASLRLHNLLATSADKASLDGLLRTAVRLADEDVQVANRQSAMYSAEALLRRARFLASLHEVALARNDVETARPLVETVHVVVPRRWLEADLHEAEAVSKFRGDPALQTSALDSAAAFFAPLPYRLLPELVGAAEARLAAGDPANAATRLERVMRLLEQRRDSIGMEPRRAAVFDAAREVVDRLVMLKLAEGRAPEALRYLDRARASLAPTGSASEQDTGDPLRSRAGEVVLEYALVADTLLVWTVTDRRVQVTRSAVDTLRLVRTIEEVTTKLEEESGEAEVRPALSQLYEWLIRPVESRLGSAGTSLVFVVDGSLAAVPFAALLEAGSGRYLVEYHPLRFAVSVREASRPPSSERAGEVLFVADPAFVQSKNKLLQPLEQARAEVRQVAKEYPNAAILEGANATRRTLLMALPHTALTHFAGHAVFDDARPERSYLVLAPDARDDAGRLTAADLARLDLRNVRLVVLSACRTVRSGRTRASGYTGLSGALLAAGAEGTVGSLWDVDDRATAALMASFHQAYSRIPDAASALRRAQLSLLRVDDPSLRSPAAWAAFRYAGR
jgi:CHAT domain-containing protein